MPWIAADTDVLIRSDTHVHRHGRMLPGKASEKAGTRMTDPQAKEQRLQNGYVKVREEHGVGSPS